MFYAKVLYTKINIQGNLAVECEVLSSKLVSFINADSKENFPQYFRSVMNIMWNNIYWDKLILLSRWARSLAGHS